jgi:uncharacterized surface protein with fasciclin (FAS1) repeats
MGKLIKKWTAALICFLLVFTSCESELEKYYATPDWLKGNAWEVLEDKGNFKLFLAAVERSSFKDLVQGKGQITVMAPTDEAFQAYLDKKGYASVNDIPTANGELDKLIGYHLVYYSFTKSAFEDYKPNGIESVNPQKGVYYKFRTKSRDGISWEKDPTTVQDDSLRVMHKDRFLPVFSFNLFTSVQIDAKSNYEFFYPNSTWTGENGFNVSNASVVDYAIITDNGYVYTINQVIEPLETVYTELAKAQDFNLVREAYDRFVTFQYDALTTTEYGKGDSLFIWYHGDDLPPIASEWTNILGFTDYSQLTFLSFMAYNMFAPDNASMQAFFNKYWAPYYSDLSQVNFEPLFYLLRNHVYRGQVLFPEIIEKGQIKSTYGTPIIFDRNSAKMKHMCVNGTLYGLDKVLVPPMFEKVTSPMFCDPKYNMILDMMNNSSFVNTLISDQVKFKVFYPSNDMILTNTTLEGKAISFLNPTPTKYGTQQVQIEGDTGPEAMKLSQKKSFAGNHIATQLLSSRNDEAIYRTINSFNYLYVKGDKVYSTSLFNTGDENIAPTFTKIPGDWTNGDAYQLSGETASALVPESNQFKNIITSTSAPADYAYFKEIIGSSGLDKALPPYSFMQGERFIVLIPKESAIYDGWLSGKIPFSPANKVADFLKGYFINVSSSNLLDYPFAGAGVQGTLVSFAKKANGEMATYTLIDSGSELIIRDGKGKEVKVISYFPRIYADGAAYLIDGLLDIE